MYSPSQQAPRYGLHSNQSESVPLGATFPDDTRVSADDQPPPYGEATREGSKLLHQPAPATDPRQSPSTFETMAQNQPTSTVFEVPEVGKPMSNGLMLKVFWIFTVIGFAIAFGGIARSINRAITLTSVPSIMSRNIPIQLRHTLPSTKLCLTSGNSWDTQFPE